MRRSRPPPVAARGPAAAAPGGPGAAPGRSCPATLSALPTLQEAAGRELPAGRPGSAQEPCPAAPPAAPRLSGGSASPPPGCQPRSPATAATSRSAAAQSPSTRSRGIAMLRFSSIAPAPPSSPLLPGPRGAPTARAGGGDSGWGSPAKPPGTGLAREAAGTLKLLAPAGASLRRTCCGAAARVSGVGSGPLRSGHRLRAISPCRLGRRGATLRVGRSVRPSLPSRRRLLQEMALSGGHPALCSPSDITS